MQQNSFLKFLAIVLIAIAVSVFAASKIFHLLSISLASTQKLWKEVN